MPEKKKYQVTETAPIEVAGRRVAPGDVLELTEPQARYELLQGFVEPFEAPSKKAAKTKSDPAGGAGAAG
jgi:hypothetical protein